MGSPGDTEALLTGSRAKPTGAAVGGGGLGGAVFNRGGTIVLSNSTLSGNSAQGGSDFEGGSAFGAAVFNLNGTLTVDSSTVAGNSLIAGTSVVTAAAAEGTLYSRQDASQQGGPATVTLHNTILAGSGSGVPDLVSDGGAR